MSRVFLFVLDSVGIGGAPDAKAFGDVGSNTLGHIAARVPLHLPNLNGLGLGRAAHLATGQNPLLGCALRGVWGVGQEISRGKDTPSGHWEIAGVPVLFDWGYFPHTVPAFPQSFTEALMSRARLPGLLGNCHASGTTIIEELGTEHMRSGKPIIYTSADSVIQIAAHEQSFGLDRLYAVCQIARDLSYALNIGRVIARPFLGSVPQNFTRTGNRKDYTVLPPSPTLFNILTEAGRDIISVGKIGDIYAHSGTGREVKASGNADLFDTTLREMPALKPGGFLMTNFVDFDMLYGHRRDVQGYAAALEYFDQRLPEALSLLQADDLLILTADHGNDPTWPGTEHTREAVPILAFGPHLKPGSIGIRKTFADIGQTIAQHLGVPKLATGTAWQAAAVS
jgi:phosphopentomutase